MLELKLQMSGAVHNWV